MVTKEELLDYLKELEFAGSINAITKEKRETLNDFFNRLKRERNSMDSQIKEILAETFGDNWHLCNIVPPENIVNSKTINPKDIDHYVKIVRTKTDGFHVTKSENPILFNFFKDAKKNYKGLDRQSYEKFESAFGPDWYKHTSSDGLPTRTFPDLNKEKKLLSNVNNYANAIKKAKLMYHPSKKESEVLNWHFSFFKKYVEFLPRSVVKRLVQIFGPNWDIQDSRKKLAYFKPDPFDYEWYTEQRNKLYEKETKRLGKPYKVTTKDEEAIKEAYDKALEKQVDAFYAQRKNRLNIRFEKDDKEQIIKLVYKKENPMENPCAEKEEIVPIDNRITFVDIPEKEKKEAKEKKEQKRPIDYEYVKEYVDLVVNELGLIHPSIDEMKDYYDMFRRIKRARNELDDKSRKLLEKEFGRNWATQNQDTNIQDHRFYEPNREYIIDYLVQVFENNGKHLSAVNFPVAAQMFKHAKNIYPDLDPWVDKVFTKYFGEGWRTQKAKSKALLDKWKNGFDFSPAEYYDSSGEETKKLERKIAR